jgi:hypothetical protein
MTNSSDRSKCGTVPTWFVDRQRKEAKDYLNYYDKEKGDWEAVEKWSEFSGCNLWRSQSHVLEEFKFHFIAGQRRASEAIRNSGMEPLATLR